MSSYPNSTYSPREKINRPYVVYNSAQKEVTFAEDIVNLDNEVVALQTYLRIPTALPDIIVTGSCYFDVATGKLKVYNGSVWVNIN